MPRKLLVADDSVTIQRVIELTFADEDVQVIAVGDGDEAIARLAADPPDVVLADVGMPGRDGYEVAEHILRTPSLAHIPVLLLTGAFDPVDETRARAAECAGVLVKPFEPQMVIARVRELLATGRRPAAFGPEGFDTGGLARPAIAGAEPPRRRVDDYFDRLDAAFASLQAADATVAAAEPVGVPEQEAITTSAPAAEREAHAPAPAAANETHASPHLADGFSALLAFEQGQPPPAVDLAALVPGLGHDVVEAVARRVTADVAERVIRELGPDIVSRVAERLVREEIERLKRAP